MSDILAKLRTAKVRFNRVEEACKAKEPTSKNVAGEWRGIRFIVSQDGDYVHCSLSQANGQRVSARQAKAFFRWWGVSPHGSRIESDRASHWSVREGVLQ